MKQLMIILLVALAVSASAQIKREGRVIRPRTRVIVAAPVVGFGMGYGYSYSPYYSPFYSAYNSAFYDPFYNNQRTQTVPSELQLRIDDLQNDYSYQISEVRHNKSISGKERREQIRALKHDKEGAIIKEKKSYYKSDKTSQ